MADETIIGISVEGAEQVTNLSKVSAEAKANLAGLQKEAASLQKELNKLTQGSEEYNKVLGQIAQKQVEVTNAKIANTNATKQLNTAVNQLTTSTVGMSQAEVQAQASFQALISTLYEYQNSADKTEAKTAAVINALEVYTGASIKAQAATKATGAAMGGLSAAGAQKGNNLLLQFNQVLRETPNFAISARIGIMSLSNNIPLLVDAVQTAMKNGQSFIQVLGTLKTAIFSVQGAFLGLTFLLTLLSNSAVLKWLGDLFTSEKKVTEQTYKLTDANEDLIDSFSKGNAIYGNAVKNINEVTYVLQAAEKGIVSQQKALDFYNDKLGTSIGKVDTFSEALKNVINRKDDYISAMREMAIATSYLDSSSKGEIAKERLQLLKDLREAIPGDNMLTIFSKGQLQEAFRDAPKIFEDFTKIQEKYNEDIQKINDENEKVKQDKITANNIIENDLNKQGLNSYKNILDDTEKEIAAKKTEIDDKFLIQRKIFSGKALNIIQEGIAKEQANIDFSEKQAQAHLEKALGYNINLLGDTKDKADKIIEYTRPDKAIPKNIDISAFTDQLDEILKASVKYSKEQQAIIDKSKEYDLDTLTFYKQFYALSKIEVDNYTIALDKARLQDLENQKKHDTETFNNLNKNIQEQRDIYNTDLSALQKTLRLKEEALNDDYIKQAELENNLATLKKLFSEAKTDYDKNLLNDQMAITDKLLADIEKRIAGNEKSVKQYKDELKVLETKRKEIEKSVTDAEEAAKKLAEIDAQISDTTLKIVEGQKNKIKDTLDVIGQFADAFSDLFSSIADHYQTNMDITNQNYDLEEKRIEESKASEESKNAQLKQLEIERYNALKKDFERQKKAKEAGAWLDLASGLVSIAAHSMDLGPIAGPILAGIEAAALILTTNNNIRKIRAEKLDSPSSSSSSISKATAAIPVTPNETALTSPQQNLNQAQSQNPVYVKVTEINNVQNTVKVREQNQTF